MKPKAAIFALILAASLVAASAPASAQIIMRGAPRTNPAEYSSYAAFDSEPDPKVKIELGEEFDQKYPLSHYRELVDSSLTFLYFNDQDWPKFYAEADKVIALNPKSVPVLELAGWVIPRHYNSHDPAAAAELAKAENYEKRALAIVTAMKKPKQVTQQQFDDSKASLTWRAYSALGANYFRRKDFADSAKNLQLAIKQEAPEPDPGDLYILGVDFENLNRSSDAADIFAQCSQITGDMAQQCQQAYETASHQIVQTAEDAAFNAFSNAPTPDAKIRLGEAFDEKFPQSGYEERVDGALINLYDHARNWDKLYATADRALATNPDNIPVLTFVGWVIPHLYDSGDAGGPAKLDASERYEKRALDLLPALQKPPDATQEEFDQERADAAALAHSGLGMTYFRRGQFEDSAKEIQLATEDTQRLDPLDFYILGIDFHKLNRPSEAAVAFTKCSQNPSDMQSQCQRDAAVATKDAAAMPLATAVPATPTQQQADFSPQPSSPVEITASTLNPMLPSDSPPSPPPASDIPSATTQAPAPLRTETIVVPVRVVVRDSKGRAVPNLHKEDFALYQDGKPQQIVSFNAIVAAGNSNAPKSPTGATTEPTAEDNASPLIPPNAAPVEASQSDNLSPDASEPPAAEMPQRFVALFFDDVHLYFEDVAPTRNAAAKYVASLPAADRVAIVTGSGENELDFTGDRDKLRAALMKLQPHPLAGGPGATAGTFPCPPPMTYTEADAIVNQESQPVLAIAAQDVAQCLHAPTTFDGEGVARALASQARAAGEEAIDETFQKLRITVRRLSLLPGQRAVVLVSPGFVYGGHERTFAEVSDLAIRSNVVINTLDAKGVYGAGPRDRNNMPIDKWDPDRFLQFGYGHDSEDALLADLADSTGGLFIRGSNDFKGAIGEMSHAPESYYLLAYSPQNLPLDGKYHALKVNVPHTSHDSIEARRGFYAPSRLETPEEAAAREIEDAVFSQDVQHDLAVKMETSLQKAKGASNLSVIADLDVANLRFVKSEGANQEQVIVAAALFDSNGNYIAGTKKTVSLKYDDKSLAELAKTGAKVDFEFPLKPGGYILRLVARDSNERRISAKSTSIKVPN